MSHRLLYPISVNACLQSVSAMLSRLQGSLQKMTIGRFLNRAALRTAGGRKSNDQCSYGYRTVNHKLVPSSREKRHASLPGTVLQKPPKVGPPANTPVRSVSRVIHPPVNQTDAFYCGLASGPNGQGSSKPRVSELYVLGPICNQFLSAFEMLVSRLALNSFKSAGVVQR